MKTNVIVLWARPWSMEDEKGNQRAGVSIQYVMSDELRPTETDDDFGYQVIKESVSVECGNSLANVPGVYEAELEMKAQGGKNVLHICGLKYVEDVM